MTKEIEITEEPTEVIAFTATLTNIDLDEHGTLVLRPTDGDRVRVTLQTGNSSLSCVFTQERLEQLVSSLWRLKP